MISASSNLFTIDAGNTNTTVYKWSDQVPTKSSIENIKKSDISIISNVGSSKLFIHGQKTFIEQNSLETFGSMPSLYGEQAGVDRLLFAYSNYQKHKTLPNFGKILLIDSGTFLTLDIISSSGFEGGVIVPGANLFNENFNKGTQLTKPTALYSNDVSYPFTSTVDTLQNASAFYLESVILNAIKYCPRIEKIVVTGGGANTVKDTLRDSAIPVEIQHNAVHLGLFQFYQNELGH